MYESRFPERSSWKLTGIILIGTTLHLGRHSHFTGSVNQHKNKSFSEFNQPTTTPFFKNTYHRMLSEWKCSVPLMKNQPAILLNPFQANVSFLYPLKTLAWNWLKYFIGILSFVYYTSGEQFFVEQLYMSPSFTYGINLNISISSPVKCHSRLWTTSRLIRSLKSL